MIQSSLCSTFVKTDEPVVMYCHEPKSTVCVRVRSLCCAFMGLGRSVSRSSATQNSFSPLKTLRALPVHPPPPLATTDCSPVPTVLPFPECPLAVGTQHASLSGRLLALRNMHVSCLRVFSRLGNSFLVNTDSRSIVWRDHSVFIHPPTKGHLGCFQLLASYE